MLSGRRRERFLRCSSHGNSVSRFRRSRSRALVASAQNRARFCSAGKSARPPDRHHHHERLGPANGCESIVLRIVCGWPLRPLDSNENRNDVVPKLRPAKESETALRGVYVKPTSAETGGAYSKPAAAAWSYCRCTDATGGATGPTHMLRFNVASQESAIIRNARLQSAERRAVPARCRRKIVDAPNRGTRTRGLMTLGETEKFPAGTVRRVDVCAASTTTV